MLSQKAQPRVGIYKDSGRSMVPLAGLPPFDGLCSLNDAESLGLDYLAKLIAHDMLRVAIFLLHWRLAELYQKARDRYATAARSRRADEHHPVHVGHSIR